jgi:hypothetical protein
MRLKVGFNGGLSILLAPLLGAALIATAPQSAHGESLPFIDDITWSTLHVVPGNGIFEQDRRLFDDKSNKLTDLADQHPNVWVRTDVKSVSVQYDGGPGQANKQIQWIIDDSGINGTVTDNVATTNNIALTDGNGKATITFMLSNTEVDSYLRVGIADCDFIGTPSTCPRKNEGQYADQGGPLNIQWQSAGYYPQVHMNNQYELRDVTWDWSLFKRDWFYAYEYALVYTKSYQVGAKVTLPYKVTDIWGTPIPNMPVDFIVDASNSGSKIKSKWSKFNGHKYTDANGIVVFTVTNLNTAKEACLNIDPTTKKKCYFAINLYATTNVVPESHDLFWPQFADSLKMLPSSIVYKVQSRGTSLTGATSNDVSVGGALNPPITNSSAGVTSASTITSTLFFPYLFNSNKDPLMKVQLYAPDVTITASDGGYVARVCPDGANKKDCDLAGLQYASDIKSISQMKKSLTTTYTYNPILKIPMTFIFTGEKAGSVTFTVNTGGQKYEIKQSFS